MVVAIKVRDHSMHTFYTHPFIAYGLSWTACHNSCTAYVSLSRTTLATAIPATRYNQNNIITNSNVVHPGPQPSQAEPFTKAPTNIECLPCFYLMMILMVAMIHMMVICIKSSLEPCNKRTYIHNTLQRCLVTLTKRHPPNTAKSKALQT